MRGLFAIVAVALLAVCMFAVDANAGGFFGRGNGPRNNGARGGGRSQASFFFGGVSRNSGNFNNGTRTITERDGDVFLVDRFGRRLQFLGNVFDNNSGGRSFSGSRRNSFGSRTFTDRNGDVYQVDQFGNEVFIGRASRGFGFGGRSGVSIGFGFGY